jgi:hypothetical protein
VVARVRPFAMGKLAALLLASVTGNSIPPDPSPHPPPPPPAIRHDGGTFEITCIQLDEPPPRMCEDATFPKLPFGLTFLRPCPDWIAKIVAEADAL